jgi:hypothetical protein
LSAPVVAWHFDPQPLHVCDRTQSGRIRKAAFERSLAQVGAIDHLFDRIGYGEVSRQPVLNAPNVAVVMVCATVEDDIRRKSILVPLHRERARDLLRGRRPFEARDQVQHQVVPANGSSGRDQLFATSGHDQHVLGVDAHVGVGARELTCVVEVDRCVLPVEEARFGEQEHTRARRAHDGTAGVHPREPLYEARIAAALPTIRCQQDRRHDDDVGSRDRIDGSPDRDWHATGQRERPHGFAHDLHVKGRARRVQHRAEGVQRVVHAAQCRDDGIRDRYQADVERSVCSAGC